MFLSLEFLNIIICVINSIICIIINKFEKILLLLSLINLKNTIITIEEKSSFFYEIKKYKNLGK
jgi:hypothetical protein